MQIVTAAIMAMAMLVPGPVRAQEAVVFRDVRVFDGDRVIAETDVLIEGGRISVVGDDVSAPASAREITGAGRTLLPGLIDGHTHTFGDALYEAVVFGVTTTLDMFTEPAGARALKEAQQRGASNDRADLFTAGVLVTAPGGHGTEYGMPIPTITSPDSAQAFVDARIAEGSDYIKLVYDDGAHFSLRWPTLSRETMQAVIDAAHARGKLAVVHVSTAAAAQDAIAAGADGLVHLFTDVAPDAAFTRLVVDRGAFVIPTMVVLKSITGTGGGAPLVDDPRIAPYLTPAAKAGLTQSFPARTGPGAPSFEVAQTTLRALHEAGVPIIAGTDAPNPGTAHGAALHRELELLVAAGLAPVDALAAATSVPARRFGLADRGRIAPGLRADLLLVAGDPTADITSTRAIEGIWKGGHPIDRAAFAARVAASAAAAGSAPAGLERGLISDFENGSLAAEFGTAWSVSTDQFAGGKSTGEAVVVEGGAAGSTRALEVQGVIKAGFPYPWSGVMWSPGAQPMQPANLSATKEIRFWTRGNGSTFRVMVFAQSLGMQPASYDFTAPREWTEVVVPWSAFGIDGAGVMALIFTGGPATGAFEFLVDQISLR